MLIVWGKQYTYRKLGYVADFCPVCRKPRAFKVTRVGLVGHIYYVSVGDGEEVGFERKCQKCPVILNADLADYASIPNKQLPMDELLKLTYPDLQEAYRSRLDLEEKVQKFPALLTHEERAALIRNPFIVMSPVAQRRLDKFRIDLNMIIAVVLMIAMLMLVPPLIERFSFEHAPAAYLTCLALGILSVLWQVATAGRRYVVREIAPVLGISLKILKPTEAELTAAFKELGQNDNKVVRKLKVTDILKYT